MPTFARIEVVVVIGLAIILVLAKPTRYTSLWLSFLFSALPCSAWAYPPWGLAYWPLCTCTIEQFGC
jgi:hypothetical protein